MAAFASKSAVSTSLRPSVAATPTMMMVEEPEWAVHVYRKTHDGAWQKMRPRNAQGKLVVVKAAVREGCIVMRRIQVRIRLLSPPVVGGDPRPPTTVPTQPQDDHSHKRTETAANRGGTAGTTRVKKTKSKPRARYEDFRTTVIRRGQTVVITSSQRLRVLLLHFRCQEDCLAFCDRLIYLNQSAVDLQMHQNNGRSSQQQVSRECMDATSRSHHQVDVPPPQEIKFYLAQLLHDQEFGRYVSTLEAQILESSDGEKMINALVGQDLSGDIH